MTSKNGLVFLNAERPLTSSDIDAAERLLGVIFPGHVRHHYLSYNGGTPSKCIFTTCDDEYVVQEFFPIKYGDPSDRLENICIDMRDKKRLLPLHLVPFADDPGGNYYCFSVLPEECGAIYFIDCDRLGGDIESFDSLADSLQMFVNALQDDVN